MAKPIKETPVLRGKNALNFLREISKSEKKKATVKEKEKISDSFDRIAALAKA